jgi:hypothetical protein
MAIATQGAAERWPTPVWLNLGDLNLLLDSLAQTTATGRRGRIDPDARPVIRKIERARDRRLRAVERKA